MLGEVFFYKLEEGSADVGLYVHAVWMMLRCLFLFVRVDGLWWL
jgi:hypothetical protein